MNLTITLHDNRAMNQVMTRYHYLHRPVIRSKLLSYGIRIDGKLIGGLIWATPPMGKKRGLFGFDGTYDRWEVLVLARFFKLDSYNIDPSRIIAECVGKQIKRGKHGAVQLPYGWKLQIDWVNKHPPKYPQNPFVPRLLLSWSDLTLPCVESCSICGRTHNGNHSGTIYAAAGWERLDVTHNVRRRMASDIQAHEGAKQSWIYRLAENPLAHERGLRNYYADQTENEL